jgi:hypothetical protein
VIYPRPILDHDVARKRTLEIYSGYFKKDNETEKGKKEKGKEDKEVNSKKQKGNEGKEEKYEKKEK